MTVEQSKTFINQYNEALHRGEPKTTELLSKYISDPVFLEKIKMYEGAFPTYTLETQDLVAEEGKVAMAFIFHGVYQNEIFGIPPKNQKVEVPGIIIYYIEGDKIVDHKLHLDTMMLMQQIGGIPNAE